jgi:hypothetical protein
VPRELPWCIPLSERGGRVGPAVTVLSYDLRGCSGGPEGSWTATSTNDDMNLNITIEYAGTSACRVWYTTTAGSDRELDEEGPGLSLRFYGLWSQICAAHASDPEVGSHAFSRVTGVAAEGDDMTPSAAHSTTVIDVLSAPAGLRPCSVPARVGACSARRSSRRPPSTSSATKAT